MIKYKVLGHLFFTILFIFSVLFYLERILYTNSAFFFFKIIELENFNIEASRYGVIFSQIFLLFALKLHLQLKTLILIYSLSFIMLYYLVYLICVYKLNNHAAGVVIMLLLCVSIRHGFFDPATETYQGLVYSGLFFAWLNYPLNLKNKLFSQWVHSGISVMIIVLCYFCHPVTIFPLLFIIAYNLIDKREWNDYKLYILAFLVVLLFSLKLLFTNADSYEGNFFARIKYFYELLPGFFNLYSTNWISRFISLYIFPVSILLSVLIFYVIKKWYLKLSFVLISICSFLVITCIIYYRGDADIMMEKNFMPMNIFIAIPFANEILIRSKTRQLLKTIFLIVILFISIKGICETGGMYKQRTVYIARLSNYTKRFPERKFVIENKNVSMETIMVPWAFAIETLIYNSIKDPDSARTVYLVDELDSFNGDIKNKNVFFAVHFWRDWDANELNKRYYNLPSGSYRVLDEKIE